MPSKTEIYHLTESEQNWCHNFVKKVSEMDADLDAKKIESFLNTNSNILVSKINDWLDEAVKLCQKK